MKNYYTVATNDDKFPSINTGYLTVGHGVSVKNKKYTKKDAVQFLEDVKAARWKSIECAEEYIGRSKHCYESIKNTFRKELAMLNGLTFRIVHVSFKDVV